MQKNGFNEALERVLAQNTAFDREAYLFLRDALDYTIKLRKKQREGSSRHVSGQELLEGIRQYALREFGPMALSVLSYWGLRRSEDFGVMVYSLIDAGALGRTDADSIEDFKGGYDFEEAFVKPFRPDPPARVPHQGNPEKSERKPDGEVRK